MLDLNEIRKVFPDWPSELDVAKVGANWALHAQSFYCAALVLDDTSRAAHEEMHRRVGEQLDVELVRRQQAGIAALFCLAFSLELAVKAALVKRGMIKDLTSGDSLPFANHRLRQNAASIDGLELTKDDEEVLDWASGIILDGKYPTSKKPSDSRSGATLLAGFRDHLQRVTSLYDRLLTIATS